MVTSVNREYSILRRFHFFARGALFAGAGGAYSLVFIYTKFRCGVFIFAIVAFHEVALLECTREAVFCIRIRERFEFPMTGLAYWWRFCLSFLNLLSNPLLNYSLLYLNLIPVKNINSPLMVQKHHLSLKTILIGITNLHNIPVFLKEKNLHTQIEFLAKKAK